MPRCMRFCPPLKPLELFTPVKGNDPVPDIHIHRPHTLSLPDARQAARRWADKAQAKFSLECDYTEGAQEDCLRFRGAGIEGTLRVDTQQFDLNASLNAFLAMFQQSIEDKINAQFDSVLAPQ